MNTHTNHIQSLVANPLFSTISSCARELQQEVYVVGGYVRDGLLERNQPKDIDFVTVGNGIALAKLVSKQLNGAGRVSIFKNFGTAMLRYGDWELEFVGARKESYEAHSRKPHVEDGSLFDDQNRRDFTINALAISLNEGSFGELVDPFGGLDDLHAGLIRTPLDPDITYSDDPLRMLRAIRFAAQLNFKIEEESLNAIKRNAVRLEIISAERIITEFNKVMSSTRPSVGLALMFHTGLLEHFFPELVALQGVEEVEGQLHKDNFYHTLEVVDNLAQRSDDLWLRWAALLHDIGKPVVKRFDENIGWTFHNHEFVGGKMIPNLFRRLKLPMGEPMRYVKKIVMLSARPAVLSQEIVTDSAVRRLLFEAGDDIDALMILCECDITTKNAKRKKRYLRNFELVREKLKQVEEADRVRNWQPPVDGQEIMNTFGLAPGPEIGLIKKAIREAILEGEIPNEPQAARDFMLRKGKEMGLMPAGNE